MLCKPFFAGINQRFPKKFKAEHEADILLHQAAKKHFDSLGLKKLPTVKALNAEYAKLLAEKKRPTVTTGRPGKKCGSC